MVLSDRKTAALWLDEQADAPGLAAFVEVLRGYERSFGEDAMRQGDTEFAKGQRAGMRTAIGLIETLKIDAINERMKENKNG